MKYPESCPKCGTRSKKLIRRDSFIKCLKCGFLNKKFGIQESIVNAIGEEI